MYIKYGSFVVVLFILYLAYLIVRPFALPIITAAVIAYVFYPLYNFINKRLKKKNLSALIMCLFVLILVILPFLFILNSLLREIPSAYNWVSNTLQNSKIWHDYIYEQLYTDFGINLNIGNIIGSISTNLLRAIQGFLASVPSRILSMAISAFFLFFFFRDGYGMLKRLAYYLPFNKKETTILFRETKKMADAVIYGQIITSVIQGILATIAYSVVGLNAPLFWGILTLFGSLIPMVGPGLVYIPLSITLIVTSFAASNTFGVIKGILLLLFSLGVISSVDNIVKPLVISDKVKIHPALIVLGVVGGLTAFGVIGVILGPLILAFLMTLFNIYEMKEGIFEHMNHPKEK